MSSYPRMQVMTWPAMRRLRTWPSGSRRAAEAANLSAAFLFFMNGTLIWTLRSNDLNAATTVVPLPTPGVGMLFRALPVHTNELCIVGVFRNQIALTCSFDRFADASRQMTARGGDLRDLCSLLNPHDAL